MSDTDNSLDKVIKILDNVKDTCETTRWGYNRFQGSKENFRKVSEQYSSGKVEQDRRKAWEYEDKTSSCVRKTFLFCIMMIMATICICILL